MKIIARCYDTTVVTYPAEPGHKKVSQFSQQKKTRSETGIPWITSRVPALTVWVYSCGEPSVGKTCKHNILAMCMNFKCVPHTSCVRCHYYQHNENKCTPSQDDQSPKQITVLHDQARPDDNPHIKVHISSRDLQKMGGFKTEPQRAD